MVDAKTICISSPLDGTVVLHGRRVLNVEQIGELNARSF